MSKRTSKEDKKKIILGYLHETKDCYLLKDLEKAIAKKGIASQAFNGVLNELVDDGMIQSAKLGISNYYWSFPSEAYKTSKRNFEKAQEKHLANQELQKKLTEQLEEFINSSNPEEKEACEEAKAELKELNSEHAMLFEKLEKLKDFDPERIAATEKAIKAYKDAANRWTDNVFLIQSYCTKKFNMERADFKRNFKISEDFDNFD